MRVERLKRTIKQQCQVTNEIEAEAERLRALLERVREWRNKTVQTGWVEMDLDKLDIILSEIDAPAPATDAVLDMTEDELRAEVGDDEFKHLAEIGRRTVARALKATHCLKCMGAKHVLGPSGGHVPCPECNAPAPATDAGQLSLRPSVQAFAEAMERKLRTHDDDRGARGWADNDPYDLSRRIDDELSELEKALTDGRDDAETEAVDVANFAMMVYDVLTGSPESAEPATDAGQQDEPLYPCAHPGCKVMRTKAEGGTTFTVCDEHWEQPTEPAAGQTAQAEAVSRRDEGIAGAAIAHYKQSDAYQADLREAEARGMEWLLVRLENLGGRFATAHAHDYTIRELREDIAAHRAGQGEGDAGRTGTNEADEPQAEGSLAAAQSPSPITSVDDYHARMAGHPTLSESISARKAGDAHEASARRRNVEQGEGAKEDEDASRTGGSVMDDAPALPSKPDPEAEPGRRVSGSKPQPINPQVSSPITRQQAEQICKALQPFVRGWNIDRVYHRLHEAILAAAGEAEHPDTARLQHRQEFAEEICREVKMLSGYNMVSIRKLAAVGEQAEHPDTPHCGVCGGKQVYIRGRYPGYDNRLVCPTCLQEKMENIRKMADPAYGKAYAAAPPAGQKEENDVSV